MNNDDLTRKPDGRYPKWEIVGGLVGAFFLIPGICWMVVDRLGLAWLPLGFIAGFFAATLLFCLGAWMDGRK